MIFQTFFLIFLGYSCLVWLQEMIVALIHFNNELLKKNLMMVLLKCWGLHGHFCSIVKFSVL